MADLSSIITQTVGSSTPGVNLITAPNESSIWTVSTITKSTTTTAAELPLGPAIPTATKFTLHASNPGTAYVDVDCPEALTNWCLQLGWFARASSGFTAAIAIASIKSYASDSDRNTDTDGTTITPRNSTIQGTAKSFQTTFDTNSQQYYRITLSFAAQSGAWYSICQVQVGPGSVQQVTPVSFLGTFGVSNTSATNGGATATTFGLNSTAWGTITDAVFNVWQTGNRLKVIGRWNSGTVGAASARIFLPTSMNADPSILSDSPNGTMVGTAIPATSTTQSIYGDNYACVLFYDGSDTTAVYFGAETSGGAYTKQNASSRAVTNQQVNVEFEIPISEWVGATASVAGAPVEEWAYNNSTSTSTDSTSFGYGQAGALIQNFAPAGTTPVSKRVRFQYPIQRDESVVILVDGGSGGARWQTFQDATIGFLDLNGGTYYGAAFTFVNSTDIDVNFYSKALPSLAWSGINTWRWVAYKCKKASLPYQNASGTASGLLNYYQEDDTPYAFKGNLGGSASATTAVTVTRIGRVVTIDIESLTSIVPTTSSIALISTTNLPTWARPSHTKSGLTIAYNNGAWISSSVGQVLVNSSGQIQFYKDLANTAYTNSAQAGFYNTQISYTV